MKSLMTIEQILELAFKGAATQTSPPPPPETFPLGEALDMPSWLTGWQGQWDEVWQGLRKALPTSWNRYRSPYKFVRVNAAGEKMAVPATPPLGVIPARVLRENRGDEAEVAVTYKPAVGQDGRLGFGMRVSRFGFPKEEDSVELTVLTLPDAQLLGPPRVLPFEQEVQIAFELTSELSQTWQEIEDWEWERLPFRLILCPRATADTREIKAKGS